MTHLITLGVLTWVLVNIACACWLSRYDLGKGV